MIVEAQLQEGYASCFGMITIRKGHISFLGMIAEAESQKLHTRRRGILLGMIVEAQSQKGHESAWVSELLVMRQFVTTSLME